jgi:hypothetical protein
MGEPILARTDRCVGFQGAGTREGGEAQRRAIPIGLSHAKREF